jgi:Tfp pilus assembly protein PilF
MRSLRIIVLAALPLFGMSQKMKVQTAWRALNDYESTLKDGKPDIAYLNKAKEAIDMALANEDTKKQGKTWAYSARIHYNYYNYAFTQELKKLEPTVADKKERNDLAYGNTPTTEFELANEAVDKIKDVDPKYMETIQDGFTKGTSELSEDDIKFTLVATQMKMEAGNIAAGKYKAKKYDEAADYFYKMAYLNMAMTRKKDTANFYNACVSAGKSKVPAKILEYNKKMVDLKIATPYNFQSMYNANLQKGDTTAAMEILKKGRATFPQDMDLLNTETNIFLAKGKQQEALANLSSSIEKDPSNDLFYLVRGNIYDNLANPKDPATGKEKDKPANFDELFGKAEADYKKVIDLNPSNKEHLYNGLYNLGVMYNNNGGSLQTKAGNLPLTEAKTKGKELEAKAQEQFKKAIPYLEQALNIKPDDKQTMMALRKLYMFTGDNAKATDMSNKLKGK